MIPTCIPTAAGESRTRSPPPRKKMISVPHIPRLVMIGSAVGAAGVVGVVVLAATEYQDAAVFIACVGLALALYGQACKNFTRANRPTNQAFDDGFEIGYDKGWREGRSAARPRVVKLHHKEGSG